MLELLTTDDFAQWFSGLASAPAEDVAATLEVIVQLGTKTEAPGSSDYLLWYEHPSVAGRPIPDPYATFTPEFVALTRDWAEFNGYTRRVVKHLESASFRARLAHLSPEAAESIVSCVARIRRLSTARVLAFTDFQLKKARQFMKTARPPGDPKVLSTAARLLDTSEIREAYLEALAAAGFDVADVPAQSAALREISLRGTAPGLRLLYGIDSARNRGLVVLGEWLDRSFYGDAVRQAERVWSQFLEGESLSTRSAAIR
jgi:hypothetical protein